MSKVTQDNVSKLYLATFGRPLDSNGLDYWTNSGIYADGKGSQITTIEQLSENFSSQTEYLDKFPTTTTDTVFINSIYQNLFQRDPDPAGLSYWLDELSSGVMTRDKAILTIINGAVDSEGSRDLSLIENRSQLSLSLALSGVLTESLAKDQNIIAAIMNVTDDVSTISTQNANIENIISNANNGILNLSSTNNTLGTISSIDTNGVLALDSSTHWSSLLDTITFSFNTTIPSDYYTYKNPSELTNGWTPLNYEQQNAVISVTNELNKIIDTQLKYVPTDGMIEFNIVQTDANTAGFSFYPGTYYDYEGDVFLSNDFNKTPELFGLEPSQYGRLTIAHELGHAMGLKHPFEGNVRLTEGINDDTNHSIMSYTSVNDYVPKLSFSSDKIYMDYIKIEPEFYSIYDIAALQSIYGINTKTNIGNDTYKLKYTDNSIITIWDAGGIDTIDLSDTLGSSSIDLREGSLNSADQYSLSSVIKLYQDIAIQNGKSQHNAWIASEITNLYNGGNLYTGKNNLGIATGTIIENIFTGKGDDIVTDNSVDNTINTSLGDDKIYLGNGGVDKVDGGYGNDILYLDITLNQVSSLTQNGVNYLLTADTFAVDFTGIEYIQLTGQALYSPEQLTGYLI